jgi:large subunit ribosomal protein L13
MKTFMAKKEQIGRKWVQVDAADRTLGRLAARIAVVLMGKHRPTYTPHVDTGDFVVVTNVARMRVTGRKLDQKAYQSYSGYPGGRKRTPLRRMLHRKPEEVLRLAVRRMLPKGALGNKMLKKLKLYGGPDHPHAAQKPEEMKLPEVGSGS